MSKNKKRNRNVASLIERFAESEELFLKTQFLAPALPGGVVRVRIGAAICSIKVAPEDFEGIGLFEPLSFTEAILVREASLAERRGYLDLFPQVRLIVSRRTGNRCFGCGANSGDSRFRIEGLVPIELAAGVQLFDTITCRYDGNRFWFDEHDSRSNPRYASDLRIALEQLIEPTELSVAGISAELRAAFEFCHWQLTAPSRRTSRRPRQASRDEHELTVDPIQSRLRESLSHAGGQLISYVEHHDSFQVTFTIDDQSFTSAVGKQNLTVFSSGICLDGKDRDFDLTSLVGVLREGRRDGEIYFD